MDIKKLNKSQINDIRKIESQLGIAESILDTVIIEVEETDEFELLDELKLRKKTLKQILDKY